MKFLILRDKLFSQSLSFIGRYLLIFCILFSKHVIAQTTIDFDNLEDLIIFKGDRKFAYRDPAAVYNNGTFYLFFTLSENASDGGYYNMIAYSTSSDLQFWTYPKIITPRNRHLNYSSPGNVIKYKNEWIICFQSYPTPNFEKYGNSDSRIYIMRSKNLRDWGNPELLKLKGDNISEAKMGRMIDPYLIKDDSTDLWWCFYKQNGVSLSYSRNLKTWTYVGHYAAGENVTVIRDNNEYVMFHSPANGIGVKRSSSIEKWGDDINLLTFDQENWEWAKGRITAATVIDLKNVKGIEKYIMFFHGEKVHVVNEAHGEASIAIAWSDDLITWTWPGKIK